MTTPGGVCDAGTTHIIASATCGTGRALETAKRAYVLVSGEVALSGDAKALRDDPRVKDAYVGESVG